MASGPPAKWKRKTSMPSSPPMLAWMLLMEVPTTSCGEAKSPASPRS